MRLMAVTETFRDSNQKDLRGTTNALVDQILKGVRAYTSKKESKYEDYLLFGDTTTSLNVLSRKELLKFIVYYFVQCTELNIV